MEAEKKVGGQSEMDCGKNEKRTKRNSSEEK